ncbi:DUF2971 domain-containing protein [Ideonella paludis]|uniref:DUF2971 domain-containing protein n=1 Tax=Ideonella paludis TaxID=1233411 RepID=A0ABS5E1H4_9BURK|nr:DUF2971 domain-containing protein [Ideonella paludis]MBQ0937261.1 DUF2971 domain-containing protein [Ideonella paludis]
MKRSIAFKYRSGGGASFERDLRGLRESQIYAASRETLNDPFEGRFDRSPLDAQFRALRTISAGLMGRVGESFEGVSAATEELLGFVDKSGVFSLSYNPLNELIWAHYGGSHQGYCIGYDLDRLVSFEPMHLHRIEVTYGNASPAFEMGEFVTGTSPVMVLNKLLGSKSLPWRYEEEVRIVATPAGLHEHDFRAVREVYFGLRCPEETRLAVMEALAGRGVTYKQVSSPYPSYVLNAVEIADAYASAPAYRSRVASIVTGAIDTTYLKPDLHQYAKYLQKAAEIVRREPYCEGIQNVDFSTSKSTPGNPVVYVQYLRGPNKWVTHHLTLRQIDEQYARLGLQDDDA